MFRKIDQWGNVDRLALITQPVNLIFKSRCKKRHDRFQKPHEGIRASRSIPPLPGRNCKVKIEDQIYGFN